MYKYVVMDSRSGKAAKWEKGPNRVADLDILPDKNKVALHNSNQMSQLDSVESNSQFRPLSQLSAKQESVSAYSANRPQEDSKVKEVELKDEWETFSVRFSIYAPGVGEGHSSEQLRIFGSLKELTRNG